MNHRHEGIGWPPKSETPPRRWNVRGPASGQVGLGFGEDTRDDYRRDLKRYAYPFFDARLGRTLSAVTPRDVAKWIAWLCEQPSTRKGHTLADGSVGRILAPLRSCFATAKREGLIRHNPADGAVLPHRPRVEGTGGEEDVRAFTREQLDAVLRVAHPRHRLMLEFLAATGVRWSELIALRWGDLVLDGDRPRAKVRRAMVRGKLKPPKSRHSRRDVPLALGASMLFERGANAVQVQRWLGHHSAAFTLSTDAHLLDSGVGEGLELAAELGQGGNQVATQATPADRIQADNDSSESLVLQG